MNQNASQIFQFPIACQRIGAWEKETCSLIDEASIIKKARLSGLLKKGLPSGIML